MNESMRYTADGDAWGIGGGHLSHLATCGRAEREMRWHDRALILTVFIVSQVPSDNPFGTRAAYVLKRLDWRDGRRSEQNGHVQ